MDRCAPVESEKVTPIAQKHWGKGVAARASMWGFRTQKRLASAVGCAQHQRVKWLKMETPPHRMTRGFDLSLAQVLRVDARILFSEFATVGPDGPISRAPSNPLHPVAA